MDTSSRQATAAAPLPLCFDLDGSLLLTDTLVEGLVGALRDWRAMLRLPGLFASGKAALKAGVAGLVELDPAALPYNQAALAFLRAEKEAGRTLVLATAADRSVAEAVNRHLGGLFDEVIASDGRHNLKAAAKADALVARFGEKGFAYAGNDRADLPVWRRAGAAIPVNASPAVAREAARCAPVERTLPGTGGLLAPLLRELRLYQWSKNLLVFVPLVAAGAVRDGGAWFAALLAFLSFGLVASALYAVNDLCDLEADRNHARKRARPFASGALPLTAGLVAVPLLLLVGGALALWGGVLLFVAAYAAMSVAYSLSLKQIQLVDVFVLAALYTIRIFAGGEASGHEISLWLLAFSGFLFLGLAFVKRIAELKATEAGDIAGASRRGYAPSDIPLLQTFSVASAFVSCLVLALYVQSAQVALIYARPALLWWMVPLMLFWQCRLLLATARGDMHDDPIVFAARDRWTLPVIAGLAACVLLAH